MYKSAKKEEKSGQKEEKSAVNEENSGMNDEKSAINEEESAMNEGKSAMTGEKSAINEEKSATNEDKSAMNGEKSAIKEDISAMNEEKSAMNGEKSATNEDKSAMNPEKNVMNEDKSGNQSGVGEEKSGTETDKSAKPQEDNKSEDDMSKTAEENIKTGQEKERRALKLDKDRSALPVEEAKRGGIIDIKASRRDNDESEDKADDSPKRSLNTVDVFDDMDDLISPYFLEKFRNTYEDDNYDRSQYAENQEERYDDDLADDDLSDISERPNRRMFGSAPIPDLNIEKPQIIKPSFDTFSTPKPFIGNIMPSPPFLQPMMRPPLPYINKINQLPNSNIRLPPQHPLFNKFQQPFPKQNFNILGNRDSGYGAPNFNAYDHNYNDINEYPYTPVSEMSRSGRPPVNPIFKKLAQASNNPRPMPVLFNLKLPIRPVTFPPHIPPRINIPPNNYNPYLFRYKRSLHQTT
ncbi:unnamed protein product [Colias eurytheme]|nr:unnamed protein product [Colias eurytheme]